MAALKENKKAGLKVDLKVVVMVGQRVGGTVY